MKQTFEAFLMEKHAEEYVGTKEMLIGNFAEWVTELSPDELIEYGDQFAKGQSKGLLEACKEALTYLEKPFNSKYGNVEIINLVSKAVAKAEEA